MQDIGIAERRALGGSMGITDAFTLVEVLATMLIVLILISLISVSLKKSVEAGRSVACSSNLRKIGVALQNYVGDNNGNLIPGAIVGPEGRYWYHVLEPYLGDRDLPLGSPDRPKWQICPSKTAVPMTWETVGYGWNYENFGLEAWNPQVGITLPRRGENSRILEVTKPSKTIIIGDSMDMEKIPLPKSSYNHVHRYLYSGYCPIRHNGGANFLFLDGHVEKLTPSRIADEPSLFLKYQ